MRVFGLPGGIGRAAKLDASGLGEVAAGRLWVLQAASRLEDEGQDLVSISKVVGVPRSTLCRWRRRYRENGPRGLEPRSRRPKRVRGPEWSREAVRAVHEVRRLFPAWGKAKIHAIVRGEGFSISESSVGRILGFLRARGLVVPAPRFVGKVRRGPCRLRPHARSRPRDYQPHQPGDLVQVDVDYTQPNPDGPVRYQFDAWDSVSRWAHSDLEPRLSCRGGHRFLNDLLARAPFPIRVIQIDRGSEFRGEFESACKNLGIPLYLIPPRHPQSNGGVERLHGILDEELYGAYEIPSDLDSQRAWLAWYLDVYNRHRPHRSLDKLSPLQFLEKLGQPSQPRAHSLGLHSRRSEPLRFPLPPTSTTLPRLVESQSHMS